MSSRTHACRFQAILFPYKDEPLRVLEERFLPADECTLERLTKPGLARWEGYE